MSFQRAVQRMNNTKHGDFKSVNSEQLQQTLCRCLILHAAMFLAGNECRREKVDEQLDATRPPDCDAARGPRACCSLYVYE